MKKLIMMLATAFAAAMPMMADTETVGGYTWTYQINGEKVTISGVSPSPEGAMEIPSELGDKPVTGIGESVFARCANLTSATIPDSVIEIGGHLFENCSKLERVVMGRQVPELSYRMFYGCEMLESVGFAEDALELEYAKEECFGECVSLKALTLEVKKVYNHAFNGCSSLRYVAFDAGLEEIGANAFNDCSNLRWVFFRGDKPTWRNAVFRNVNAEMEVLISVTSNGFPDSTEGHTVTVIPPPYPPPYIFNVKFDLNGAPGVPLESRVTWCGDEIGELPEPSWEGHTFEGWFTESSSGTQVTDMTKVKDDMTCYAHWIVNQYTITFDANGGEGGWSRKLPYGTKLEPPTVTREGYTFKDWIPAVPDTVPAHDATYVAQWNANPYTVTFHANGGTGDMASTGFVYDVEYTLPSNLFMNVGHTFDGWSSAPDGKVEYSDGTTVSNLTAEVDGAVCLYAIWAVNQYTVTFDANGGEGGWSRKLPYGTELEPPTVTREGYTFKDWIPAVPDTVPAHDATYVAQWPCYEVLNVDDIREAFVAPKAVVLSGAVYDDCDVVGIVELKLGKVSKGKSKVSGSFTGLDGKKITLKAVPVTGIDGSSPAAVSLDVKGYGKMNITIGGSRFAGSLGDYHVQSATVGGNWTGRGATVTVEANDLSMFAGRVLANFLPNDEQANVNNGKWTFNKAASVKWAKPKKDAVRPDIYDEDSQKGLIVDTSKGKTNLSGLKLTYTPKKGTYKGKFTLYALEGSGKATKLKKYTFNVTGVVVDGVGYGVATSKKPTVSWAVTVR